MLAENVVFPWLNVPVQVDSTFSDLTGEEHLALRNMGNWTDGLRTALERACFADYLEKIEAIGAQPPTVPVIKCPNEIWNHVRVESVRPEGADLIDLELRLYWPSACPNCALRDQCTTSSVRRIRRWEHQAVIDRMQQRLDRKPDAMTLRRSTIEHVFGTLKHWMGSTHFLMKTMAHVGTEMSLHVLAYNLKRVMSVLGVAKTMKAMRLVGA